MGTAGLAPCSQRMTRPQRSGWRVRRQGVGERCGRRGRYGGFGALVLSDGLVVRCDAEAGPATPMAAARPDAGNPGRRGSSLILRDRPIGTAVFRGTRGHARRDTGPYVMDEEADP
ncbi:hypothetical protein GCM10010303_27580 [Streptomyces purpurascens]|nr:hypothetical protein GCM10010303_27580 [Streptomyces purpurascens]